MSKYTIEQSTLTAIGDAIRAKGKTSELIPVNALADSITNLPSGGEGGSKPPKEALVITGSGREYCKSALNKWLCETYPTEISSKDITNLQNFFTGWERKTFPCDIYAKADVNWYYSEYCCDIAQNSQIETIPHIYIDISEMSDGYDVKLSRMFSNGHFLKTIPTDLFEKMFNWQDAISRNVHITINDAFSNCLRLEKLPNLTVFGSDTVKTYDVVNSLYHMAFVSMYLVREVDLPIYHRLEAGRYGLGPTEAACLRHFTFDKNRTYYHDEVLDWNGVELEFTNDAYSYQGPRDVNYQYVDECISDKASYDKYKNSANSWVKSSKWSFYNHDAALETIQSLPQTSGTNTAIFDGSLGASTDAGAINTLTPEEIAIATDKGFTVAFK